MLGWEGRRHLRLRSARNRPAAPSTTELQPCKQDNSHEEPGSRACRREARRCSLSLARTHTRRRRHLGGTLARGPAGAPKHDLAADLQLGALERLDLAVVDKGPVCGVQVGDCHLVAALCAAPRALSKGGHSSFEARWPQGASAAARSRPACGHTGPAPRAGPPRSQRPDAAGLKWRRGAHRPAALRAGWTQWGPAR